MDQGRLSEYKMEEEDLICSRFPHLNFCSCSIQCNISLKDANPIEVIRKLNKFLFFSIRYIQIYLSEIYSQHMQQKNS